jgi:hypothetical protein
MNFGHLQDHASSSTLQYSVGRSSRDGFFLKRGHYPPIVAADKGSLLFSLEKDMVIELQKFRHDLYFVHSGVLEFNGQACMLAAPSGNGKSTSTWALLHHGFRYMSDELAAVHPQSLEVYPYAHALSLKSRPPAPYRLPAETYTTSYAMLVPVGSLPSECCNTSMPLVAIFFVTYSADISAASVRLLSSAEGGIRLYANALNPLAHSGAGLDAAIEIAEKIMCFELLLSDLPMACKIVKRTLEKLFYTQ